MTIKDDIRKMKQTDTIVNLVIITSSVILLYMLYNKAKIYNIFAIIFLTVFMFMTFNMDLSYAQKLEKEVDHPVLRINSKRFNDNSVKELARYVEDVSNYDNIWRISMCMTCAICLLLYTCVQTTLVPIFPYLFLIIFCIIYHTWNWKTHHSHHFMTKSVIEACRHLIQNEKQEFKQSCHI
jgi:Na+/H+ antiporter NhaC